MALVKSTSPEISAAMRVASELMGVNSIRSRLWRGVSHQSGLRTRTVRLSAVRLSRRNGPVPLAWLVA